MQIVKEKAYAKINLFLDVLSCREDGFHEIRSVMHTVSLCDDVTVKLTASPTTKITIRVEDAPYVPADSRNLAYRAAELFLRAGKLTGAVDIHLLKRIPTAAGMAGGSSDAAAVLRALNRLYKKPFSTAFLLKLAAELGSDVPFCLLGRTALCEGRGERMQPFTAPMGYTFVVACGDERISAKAGYEMLDERYDRFSGRVPTGGDAAYSALRAWLCEGGARPDFLFNVFEEAVLSTCPCAAHIKDRMQACGAVLTLVSGSGPSVFGVYENAEAAGLAAEGLRAEDIRAFAVISASEVV